MSRFGGGHTPGLKEKEAAEARRALWRRLRERLGWDPGWERRWNRPRWDRPRGDRPRYIWPRRRHPAAGHGTHVLPGPPADRSPG